MSRIPPQNIEAEQSTLASMMIERAAMERGLELLRSDDFYRPAHQKIFEALQALEAKGEPADLITLQEELRSRGRLAEVGGTEYLMSALDVVPTAANIEHYARIVYDKSHRRKIIAELTNVIANCYEEDAEGIDELLSAKALELTTGRDLDGPQRVGDLLTDHLRTWEERREGKDRKLFSSGLPSMDSAFGKLGQARYILLRAKRGKGKTHFAIHFLRQVALGKRAGVFYSLEMSRGQALDRLIACFGDLDTKMFRDLNDEHDWSRACNAMGLLYEPAIYLVTKRRSVAQMFNECKRLKLQGVDLGLVAIDYAKLIVPRKGCYNPEHELSQISDDIGQMSKELDCTIVLLSQVNKEGVERGSEELGNRADLLLEWLTDNSPHMLHAEKCRIGDGFACPCRMDYRTSRVTELDTDYED